MQFIASGSAMFSPDQQVGYEVDYWETPYTPLQSDIASAGIIMNTAEPFTNGPWTLAADLQAAGSGAAAVTAFNNAAFNHPIVNGRWSHMMDYWAGGAPGWFGASQVGQFAVHFTGFLRSATARAWFAGGDSIPITIAFAGNGYFRIDKNGTNIYSGKFTEQQYLQGGTNQAGAQVNAGLQFASLGNCTTGDQIDFYYVESPKDLWGGYVFKAIYGDVSNLLSIDQQTIAQVAPVIGCGLFDDNAPPTKQVLTHISQVQVVSQNGSASEAIIVVPIFNTQRNDGTGWEYHRGSSTDPGYLRHWTNGIMDATVKRGRVIRAKQLLGTTESYTIFTGYIDDFDDSASGNVQIKCIGFERRLLDTADKNYPDRIDYMSRGYTHRLGATAPVYSLPALDNWPMEWALENLCYRAGIDSSRFVVPLRVAVSTGADVPVQPAGTLGGGAPVLKFRARTLNGKQLRLERPPHYGNYGQGFDETIPVDDAYVFKPEPTQELWARVRSISERYGYDCRADEFGDMVLMPRNNPHFVYKFTAADGGSPTRKAQPDCYGGIYFQYTGTPTVTKQVTGARIDVIMPRFVGAGLWTFTVRRVSDSALMASGAADPSIAAGPDEFFYDFRAQVVGTNGTLVTIFSGDYDVYTVTLTGVASGTRRLDAILSYHTDPVNPKYPTSFSTALNASSIVVNSSIPDSRNYAIFVGRRNAVVTDSEKLDRNPNNPELEFAVASAVDVHSITDPTAVNYWGAVKESVIYNSNITDQDFANYAARVFIFRYGIPQPGASVTNTAVPVMQLRDPVFVEEDRYQTMAGTIVQFVRRIEHRLSPGRATTSFETTPLPEFPAYEPRNDIDIDQDFRDSRPVPPGTGIGVPVANVLTQYVSLTGQVITSPDQTAVHSSQDTYFNASPPGDVVLTDPITVSAGSPDFLSMTGQPWPPVPGTMYLRATNVPDLAGNPEEWDYGTAFGYTVSDDPITPGLAQGVNNIWGGAVPDGTTPTLGQVLYIFITIQPGGTAILNEIFTNIQAVSHVFVQEYQVLNNGPNTNTAVSPFKQPYEIFSTASTTGLYYQVAGDASASQIVIRLPSTAPQAVYFAIQVQWIQAKQGSALDFIGNTPYHRFFTIDYTNRKVLLNWEQGNGTAPYQRNPLLTQFEVQYRRLGPTDGSGNFVDPYGGVSPFYDPYTSELGNLVLIQFDALITGLYRISIRSMFDPDTVVAWITNSTADQTVPNAHWQFIDAGAAKQFFWDGVDNVGDWNRLQSQEYANDAHGTFEQAETPIIGDGFYSWNREQDAGAPGPFALISGDLDGSNRPIFGHGPYSSWFIRIEATNDDLAQKAQDNPAYPVPRVTDTSSMDPALNNGTGAALVHTYLPEPTHASITVLDWDPGATPFDTITYANGGAVHWNSTPDTDATISNFQPVNIRFTIAPRPGTLWAGLEGEVDVKLFRVAHLKRILHDQFIQFDGSTYPNSLVTKATVVNRRLANDTHTILYQDTDYRQAKTFKNADNTDGVEWVFIPMYFAKDFRGVPNEPINFGDYLQLEEVPGYDPTRNVTGTSSRYVVGFISDVFYLSAYTQDRSGRFVWCLNTDFVDTSKILNNTVAAEFPDDMVHQHRRTIVARCWTNELQTLGQSWVEYQMAKWGISEGTFGETMLRHKWSMHDPIANGLNLGHLDLYSNSHVSDGSLSWYGGDVQIPWTTDALHRQMGTGDLGTIWTWETGPTWIPSVTRDFHPYFLVPPMPDFAIPPNGLNAQYSTNYVYATVDARGYIGDASSPDFNTGNDLGAGDTWSSYTVSQDSSDDSKKHFRPGTNVAGHFNTPNFLPPPNSIDYIRQDELQHYEDFRGTFSRKARPGEAPVKVTPVLPYFINMVSYSHITKTQAFRNPAYPKFFAAVSGWFDYRFRHEYLWESGSFFPTNDFGVEQLKYANMNRSRFFLTTPAASQVKFDTGGWTGWKDDSTTSNFLKSTGSPDSIFEWGTMPYAVSSRVAQSREPFFHLILLNERRGTPVSPTSQPLPSQIVGAVTIAPASISVAVGTYTTLVATAIATDSTPLKQRVDFTWAIADPTICSLSVPAITYILPHVTNQIALLGLRAGTTTVTANCEGITQTLTVTVT